MKELLFVLLLLMNFVGIDGQNGDPFFFHVNKKAIVDADDNPFELKGFNIGGWITYQHDLFYSKGNSWDVSKPNEHTLRDYLDTHSGAGSGDRYFDGLRENWIQEKDIEYMATLGANLVRVGIPSWLFTTVDDVGFQMLDELVGWANMHGLYVIIDLHAAPGCQSSAVYCSAEEDAALWENESYKQETINLWVRIATQYHNESTIVGYDLLHAPDAPNDEQLESLYKDIIVAIRAVDKNHILFVQGNDEGTDFGVFENRWVLAIDNNTAYALLLFPDSNCPLITNYESSITKYLDPLEKKVQDDNLPIFIAEYGGECSNWLKASIVTFQERPHLTPTTHWNYKGMPSDSDDTFIHIIDDTKNWDNLMSRLKKHEFATDPEWNNALADVGFDNFVAREDRLDPLNDYFMGVEVTYTYSDGWILGVIIGGVVLLTVSVLALIIFLVWRKRKKDPFYGL